MRGLFTELSVPFEDAELSNDELVRRLELVRTNIGLIAPFRPESYKIVLYAGVGKSPKPQLLMPERSSLCSFPGSYSIG